MVRKLGRLRGDVCLCQLWRHAQHGVGERAADNRVPALWVSRVRGRGLAVRRDRCCDGSASRRVCRDGEFRHRPLRVPADGLVPIAAALHRSVPAPVQPLALGAKRPILPACDRGLSHSGRRDLVSERDIGRDRPPAVRPTAGRTDIGQADRGEHRRDPGRLPGRGRFRRDHVLAGLADPRIGRDVHARYRAPLRFRRQAARRAPGLVRAGLRAGVPRPRVPLLAGGVAVHLRAGNLGADRIRRIAAHAGGDIVLAAGDSSRRGCVDRDRGRAVGGPLLGLPVGRGSVQRCGHRLDAGRADRAGGHACHGVGVARRGVSIAALTRHVSGCAQRETGRAYGAGFASADPACSGSASAVPPDRLSSMFRPVLYLAVLLFPTALGASGDIEVRVLGGHAYGLEDTPPHAWLAGGAVTTPVGSRMRIGLEVEQLTVKLFCTVVNSRLPLGW